MTVYVLLGVVAVLCLVCWVQTTKVLRQGERLLRETEELLARLDGKRGGS